MARPSFVVGPRHTMDTYEKIHQNNFKITLLYFTGNFFQTLGLTKKNNVELSNLVFWVVFFTVIFGGSNGFS